MEALIVISIIALIMNYGLVFLYLVLEQYETKKELALDLLPMYFVIRKAIKTWQELA